jgi:hypothetical protein
LKIPHFLRGSGARVRVCGVRVCGGTRDSGLGFESRG